MSVLASPTRRSLLTGAAAGMWGCVSGCSWTRRSGELPRDRPSIGFLRQTDAAPLLIADELGAYARQGLAPTLNRGASPADLQQRLSSGELCVAQLPASQPVLDALLRPGPPELISLMVMSQNGAAITLGREFCASVKFLDLAGLRLALLRRPSSTPAVFAVTVLGGSDDLMLRYMLAAAGIPADRVQVVQSAVERMLVDLREERIVGFAAPDPWSALAAAEDLGFTFATAQDVCRRVPRSVLATTPRTLSQRRPELKALVRAVVEAAVWLDVPANRARPTVGEVLARRQHLDLDAAPIRARLGSVYELGCRLGERDFEEDVLSFHRAGRVNFPLRADVLLCAALLARFGLAPPEAMPARAVASIHDELYREVAADIGLALPGDMKPFVVTLDAVRFDPGAPPDWPALWPHAGR